MQEPEWPGGLPVCPSHTQQPKPPSPTPSLHTIMTTPLQRKIGHLPKCVSVEKISLLLPLPLPLQVIVCVSGGDSGPILVQVLPPTPCAGRSRLKPLAAAVPRGSSSHAISCLSPPADCAAGPAKANLKVHALPPREVLKLRHGDSNVDSNSQYASKNNRRTLKI